MGNTAFSVAAVTSCMRLQTNYTRSTWNRVWTAEIRTGLKYRCVFIMLYSQFLYMCFVQTARTWIDAVFTCIRSTLPAEIFAISKSVKRATSY